jgi:hypothetical protein
MTATLLAGCAENAVLQLEVPLPAAFVQDSGRIEYAVVQARRGPTDYDVAWLDEATDPIPLGDRPFVQRVDLVAEGETIGAPLAIKVVYCQQAEGCGRDTGGFEVSRWYRIERAFYTGAYTQLRLPMEAVPIEDSTEAEVFGRCQVGGCGSDPDSTAPQRGCIDGRHLCE